MRNILIVLKKVVLSWYFMTVLGVLIAYCAFAYLAVDPLARWALPKVAESQLASRLQVARVAFDPWRLVVTVDGLQLSRPDGAPLAGFERLVVDFEVSGLARWAWRFKKIRLTAPQATLDIAPDGRLNWAELIAKLNEDKTSSDQVVRVLIDHILIERGHILYQERNRPTPFKAVLQPLGLELAGLSTLPEDRGDYSIVAKLPEQGGTLKWQGDIALNPIASNGVVAVDGVKLAKLMRFVRADVLPFKVTDGALTTQFSYRFAMLTDQTQTFPQLQLDNLALTLDRIAANLPAAGGTPPSLQAEQLQLNLPRLEFSMQNGTELQFQDMALTLRQLSLARQDDSLLRLQQAEVKGIAFDLAANRLKVADVLFSQGAIVSRRAKNGASDWQQLVAGFVKKLDKPEVPVAAKPEAAAAPLAFAIDRVRFEHWQARHQDQAFVHPLDLTAGTIDFDFALNNDDGAVALRGFNGQIASLGLKSSLYPQPVAMLANISLNDGAVSLKDNSASLAGVVLSGLQIQGMAQKNDRLLRLQQAEAKGIAFDLAANKLKVADVLFSQGAILSRRGKNGDSDWQQLAAGFAQHPAKAEVPVAAKPEAAASPLAFAVDRVRFEHWQARHQDQAFVHPLDLTAGTINFNFALNDDGGALALRGFNGQIASLGLKSSLYPQLVATLANISLQNGAVSTKNSSASLAGVVLTGLQTRLLRSAGKPLNWQSILETPPASKAVPTADAAAPTKATAWKASLGRLVLKNAAVHVEDRSTRTPVNLDLQSGMVELKKLSLDMKQPVPFKARLQVKQGGVLEMTGKLKPQPLQADLQIKLDKLSLKSFSPYLNQVALLKLDDGSVNANVQGKLELDARQALKADFRGGFAVSQLAVSEEKSGEPFLAWKEVSSDSVRLTLGPDRLHLDAVRVVQPAGKFIIHEDGSMNVKRILRPAPVVAKQPPGASGKEGFPVAVERVRIDNGSLDFADLTLRPQFGAHIDALSGVINGLSSDPVTTAQVELDGKVDKFGSARVRGSVQPFNASEFTDLKLTFRNLDMHSLTPYSGKFAGRRIESGRMSADLEYKIKQRQLAGENKFVINKLKLGERVESRDALDLPLDLAIAILEDSDGVIDLDLPIAGNLDDPKFSYGKVIWKAIGNILTKIVTAPFRALGKLFGGDSEKMQAVGFDAGSSVLAPQEQEKLKMLADVMAKRPALGLTILPAFDPASDTAALQEQATRRDVLIETGLKLPPDEQPGPLDLNNTKVQSAIERLHNERTGGKRGSKMLDDLKDYFRKSKPEDLPKYTELLVKLRATVQVPESELAGLAKARAEAMQGYLVKSAGLAANRVGVAKAVKSSGDGKAVNLKMELGVKRAATAPQE